MDTERMNDVSAFRNFLDEKLSNGGASFTLDEVLRLWEYENTPQKEREQTLQAIRQGLADVEAGRVRPFEDFDREFREKHGMPPRA